MRLVADEVPRGRVGRNRGQRDDEVAERVVRLQAAARADAHELLRAELDELLEHDRRAGAAHAGALDGDRLPFPRAGEAEKTALLVHLLHVLEVRVRDVLGAEGVAGEKDGVGVVAWLGTKMDWHRATLTCDRIER